jgi:hypothetical protein
MALAIARGALVVAITLAASCSLMIPAELEEIRCTVEGAVGPPVCDPGYVCASGVCTRCAPSEICDDGFDNDCFGGVDNGCAIGGNGGSGPDAAGGAGGSLPDASAGGAGGSVGGAAGASGTGGSGGAVGGAGGGGNGGVGGSSGAPGVGTPCTSDSMCDPAHFCATDPAIVGVSASGLCTRGCCTSSDCGGGNVCFVTPRGNNLCFPGNVVNRPALGTKSPGSGCTAPAECRSGLCEGGLCVDACCSNVDCGGSLPHCTLRGIAGAPKMAYYCGASGSLSFNQICFGSGDCQSNYCVGGSFTCTTRCCKKSDCASAGSDWSCIYQNQTGYAAPVCLPAGTTGTRAIGEDCGTPEECQSGKCLSLSGLGSVCTDACCRDEDCGDTAKFECRVLNAGGAGLLLCVPL